MLGVAIATTVLCVLVVWTWQLLNWAWFRPRKMEKLLRKQGMKGNPYKFLVGDSKETSLMYEKAFSKPIGLHDDIVPRVMPNILHTLQQYGSCSFSWSGPRPRIFINDPAVARSVFSKHRLYHKTFKICNKAVQLLVTGMSNLEGQEWTTSRSKFNPAFQIDKLKPMVPAIQMCCVEVIKKWKDLGTEKDGSCVVDMYHELEIFTSSVIAQLMFSSTYTDHIKKTFLILGELAVLAKLPTRILTIPGEQYLPTKMNRRSKEIDRFVRASFISMINERLKKNAQAPSGHRDLLDILLEDLYEGRATKESERRKVIEDAIGECKMFFFAGFETSSNLLTWAMVLLSSHPEWQARAREEVFRVLGDKKDITSDDLTKLKIVTMIVNETLRLYPPLMELSRLIEEDSDVNGYTIPKGSLVTFPVVMFHRSTDIWGEDAGKFRPDRFADGALKAANGNAAFMPFGWGPRICIGMNFGQMEAKTFLAMLLREFSFELSPTYTHAPAVAFTVHPQFGAPVVLRKL